MNITDVWLTVKEQYWYDVIKTNIRTIFLIVKLEFSHCF